MNDEFDREQFARMAAEWRYIITDMICRAGSGHLGGALSLVEVVMTLYGAMRVFDVLDRAGEIQAPTLMIHGFHDIQLPVRQMLRMAKAYPDAVVRIIDAGHELPVERPAEVTTALDRFLTAA